VSPLDLDAPVREIDPRLANRRLRSSQLSAWEVLAGSLGIVTVWDLLHHYPRRYIDRSSVQAIRDLRRALSPSWQPSLGRNEERELPPAVAAGQDVTVIGHVETVQSRRTRRGQVLVNVRLRDDTGSIDLPFFNQPWIARTYRHGMELAVSGRLGTYRGKVQLANQEVEVLRGDDEMVHTGRITPVHRAADGVSTRTIRELVYTALQRIGGVPEELPADVVAAERLNAEGAALHDVHFPEDPAVLARALDRLKFDELFALELGVAYRKHRVERQAIGVPHDRDPVLAPALLAHLPFQLTSAQRRAMKEIAADMASPKPMNRLLQGDVGSGKTVVALYGALVAAGSGHQATIMAPTEILAGQHARTVRALLEPLGGRDVLEIRSPDRPEDAQASLLDPVPSEPRPSFGPTFALLTAGVTGKDRLRVLEGVASGEVDLVVGTHALVQEGVEFADLSLAVIDEQHRFGVHQRVTLKEKGVHADVLIMTATPIPRTLALTYYGDLDVSVLDDLPTGRRPVRTVVARDPAQRSQAYRRVREEVAAGRQAYVVCAAIDESNRLEVRAAEREAQRLATDVFPDLRIALLHGRMRPAEKDAVMEDFRRGEKDILISTTVIEVGVDVPNASVMLVENAERFGLAQLHQLRGRIGRGGHQSFCILFDESAPENEEARVRLDAMVRTTDGFELADVDLRQRGEGTLFDIKQSGLPDLKLAKLAEDVELVRRARRRAFDLIEGDPELDAHPELVRLLRRAFSGDAIEWLFHS
jgi:ATP-dependent DNA helicase RecG